MAYIPPPPVTDEGLPAPLQMTEREKALRDMFVAEYLVDYAPTKACMRIGFPREFAIEWAQKLLDEPYVQQMINRLGMTKPEDEDSGLEYDRQRVKQRLMQEAHNYGPGSSHAARVAALANLAKILDMDPAKKVKVDVNSQGGVMRVPGAPTDVTAWETAAMGSQAALTGTDGN